HESACYSTLLSVVWSATASSCFFLTLSPPQSSSTLFPYTTLFRSLATRNVIRVLSQESTHDVHGFGDSAFGCCYLGGCRIQKLLDRKSTRLNSSHDQISYAVFCLKKKTP